MLEGAVALAEDEEHRADGRVSPTLADVEAAAQQRVLAYDRAGDGHYDTVSAFIKSIRGNDPDGALYWLASMIAAGEDPRFIVRRLIIAASEDIGNADPRALQVAVAAAQALDHVGLPGGAVRARPGDDLPRHGAEVEPRRAGLLGRDGRRHRAAARCPCRNHLKTAGDRRMKPHGIGVGYLYPHEFEGSDVDQQYLPDELADRRYYQPSEEGSERRDRRADGRAPGEPGGGQAEARAATSGQRHERHRRRDEGPHRGSQAAGGHAEEGRGLTANLQAYAAAPRRRYSPVASPSTSSSSRRRALEDAPGRPCCRPRARGR